MILLNVQVKRIQNSMIFIITSENVHLTVYLVQMYASNVTHHPLVLLLFPQN
jgi:hypothetical protein